MKEETKVDISVMKHEMENNELTPDVKSSIHSGVIPVVPAVEKKPVEEPAVVDSSITNNEVAFLVAFDVVYRNDRENCYGNWLLDHSFYSHASKDCLCCSL